MSQPADPTHVHQGDAATQDDGAARSADDARDSRHASTPAPVPAPRPAAPAREGLGDRATGDIVIDSALQDLRDAPTEDLDAQIEAGRRVHRTLQGRLSDLGGE
ncbi:hypothetical protein GCM10027517_25800 [Phycicoccus ginsengisoli]